EYADVLMDFLVDCAWTMGKRRPVAFRGGGFRYNDEMLKAMDSHRLTLSFNYNVDTPHQLNNEQNLSIFRWNNGIVEVPTTAINFRGHLNNFDLRSASGVDFGDLSSIHESM